MQNENQQFGAANACKAIGRLKTNTHWLCIVMMICVRLESFFVFLWEDLPSRDYWKENSDLAAVHKSANELRPLPSR